MKKEKDAARDAQADEPTLEYDDRDDDLDDFGAQCRSFSKPTQRVKRSQRKRKKFAGSVVDHDQELICQAKRLLIDSRAQSRQSQSFDLNAMPKQESRTVQDGMRTPDIAGPEAEVEPFGSPPSKADDDSPGSPDVHNKSLDVNQVPRSTSPRRNATLNPTALRRSITPV